MTTVGNSNVNNTRIWRSKPKNKCIFEITMLKISTSHLTSKFQKWGTSSPFVFFQEKLSDKRKVMGRDSCHNATVSSCKDGNIMHRHFSIILRNQHIVIAQVVLLL